MTTDIDFTFRGPLLTAGKKKTYRGVYYFGGQCHEVTDSAGDVIAYASAQLAELGAARRLVALLRGAA